MYIEAFEHITKHFKIVYGAAIGLKLEPFLFNI